MPENAYPLNFGVRTLVPKCRKDPSTLIFAVRGDFSRARIAPDVPEWGENSLAIGVVTVSRPVGGIQLGMCVQ